MTDAAIEARLRELFEENYELLRADGGHALSPEVKLAALTQVLLYWRKLKGIATKGQRYGSPAGSSRPTESGWTPLYHRGGG